MLARVSLTRKNMCYGSTFMRIALFGGSFNPPHVAHQLACAYVLGTARPPVDEVWMVPAWKHPFDKQLVPFADRLAMCERSVTPFGGRVSVSRIEAELGGESYTIETVQALKKRYPQHTFALVIGADLVDERVRWHRWPELERMIEFIIVGRGGYPHEAASELVLPEVSSSEVRERIARGESVASLVPADVVDYIREHGLYRA
jgi:nicotinate-nucleotide adenylyltransferase